jgi:hypothetical protein
LVDHTGRAISGGAEIPAALGEDHPRPSNVIETAVQIFIVCILHSPVGSQKSCGSRVFSGPKKMLNPLSRAEGRAHRL